MIKKILLGTVILFGLISCNSDDDSIELEAICDPSNTIFSQLYNNLSNSPSNQDETTMDLETHSYTFEVSSNKIICQIGYQSVPDYNSIPYLIEIYDNTSSILLYSENHIFSSSTTSYISITPINIESGHSYTINRIQTNWNGNIVNTIGRLVHGNLSFPNTLGELTITGSTFYGTGGPADDWGIPFIDIVFQD